MSLSNDLRLAPRALRRRPGLALAIIATLALAVGANGAVFTVVRALLLRDLPFASAGRLVALQMKTAGGDRLPISIPDFADLGAARTLDAVVGWSSWSANLTGVDEPVRLQAQWTTPGFFDLLGVHAALGRTPSDAEQRSGGARVALLSDGLWRSRFGADPAILGRGLTLNGETFTVIGVLPREFVFLAGNAQLIAPLVLESDPRRTRRGAAFLRVIGRLRVGVPLAAARQELDAVVARLRATYPETNGGIAGIDAQPLAETVVGGYRSMLLLLQGSAAVVLLIACLNLANLLLARVLARRAELAARAALGARRGDLLRLILVEAALPVVLGGVLGIAVASLGARAFLVFGPAHLPRSAEVVTDLPLALFTFALAGLAGLGIAILPALRAGQHALGTTLRISGRGAVADRGGVRVRAVLVAVEVGLSLVLLVGAGLLLRSLWRLRAVEPGYSADHLLAFQLALPRQRYRDGAAIARYGAEVTARLASVPGVTDVATASLNPLTPWHASINFGIEGSAAVTRERPATANYRAVAPGYFRTLRTPVLAGRDVASSDDGNAVPVAVVSETLARTYFPATGPLGARLRIDDTEGWRVVDIVGVVGDVKHAGLDADGTADVYVPYAQTPPEVSVWLANIFCVAVRTVGDPQALLPPLQRELRQIDRDVATSSARTMTDAVGASLADRRFNAALLLLLGFAALGLALAGIYAVTALSVAERRKELGVRVSLGAQRRQILGLVIGGALRPVAYGLALGLLAALALGRVIASLLFGVSTHDAGTLTSAALALAFAAGLASAWPAWRATRIHPAQVLRQD